MNWQPIETAPKGIYEEVTAGNRGGVKKIYKPDYILAPTSDRKVTITYWVPETERWSMFSKKHPPKYWMPLPEAPEEEH